MKILFTSAGSIGSRHIRNVSSFCNEKGIPLIIDVIRKTDRILSDDLKTLIRNEIREEVEEFYDIVFITDETKTHFDNILNLKSKCRHMFIEKPIFDHIHYDVDKIMPEGESVYYVACPIRFSNYYAAIKKEVEKNEIYSARIIFSSYMPNWQKGRDYKKSFRCFKSRGGGVDIDSLHEIDYMTSLFGKPKSIFRKVGQYSDLIMDAPDLAVFIFEYNDKVVEMHLDYFGRVNNRRVELFAKDDVILVDFNKHIVEYQLSGEVNDFGFEDDFYKKEMEYFMSLVLSGGKKKNINTVENALLNLRIAKGNK